MSLVYKSMGRFVSRAYSLPHLSSSWQRIILVLNVRLLLRYGVSTISQWIVFFYLHVHCTQNGRQLTPNTRNASGVVKRTCSISSMAVEPASYSTSGAASLLRLEYYILKMLSKYTLPYLCRGIPRAVPVAHVWCRCMQSLMYQRVGSTGSGRGLDFGTSCCLNKTDQLFSYSCLTSHHRRY